MLCLCSSRYAPLSSWKSIMPKLFLGCQFEKKTIFCCCAASVSIIRYWALQRISTGSNKRMFRVVSSSIHIAFLVSLVNQSDICLLEYPLGRWSVKLLHCYLYCCFDIHNHQIAESSQVSWLHYLFYMLVKWSLQPGVLLVFFWYLK